MFKFKGNWFMLCGKSDWKVWAFGLTLTVARGIFTLGGSFGPFFAEVGYDKDMSAGV